MALRSRNQVDLVINSTVEGLEAINKLARDLDNLGNEGEEARQELVGLTNQLQKLAAQSGAIENFRRQKIETEQLAKAYAEAKARSTELGRALSQTNEPAKQQAKEFQQARNETKRLNDQYKASAAELQRLRTALVASGVSLRNLGEEYSRVSQQTKLANNDLARLSTNVRQLQVTKPIPDLTKPLREGAEKTNNVVASLPRLLAAIGVTAGLAQVIQAFNEAAKSGETFERALNQITQNADATAAQVDRLQGITEKYGLEVTGLERAFLNFNAAIQGTNFEGEKGNEIFESFAGALGALGKSSADIEGALLAVNQIISKNTVSSEELRQQLAERLPGAFRLSAEALGVTTGQLSKLLETGQITADDLLPKLATRLREAYSLDTIERVEGLAAAQNRLSTAVTNLFRSISESGVGDALEGIINGITAVVNFFSGASDEANKFAVSTDDVAEAAKNLSPELQQIAADMQLVGLETSKSSAELEALRAATDSLAKLRNVDNLKRQFADLQTSIANAEAQLKQLYEGISNPEAFGIREDGIRTLQQSIVLLEASLTKMRAESAVLSSEIDSTLNPAVEDLGDKSKEAAENTRLLINELSKQTDMVRQFAEIAERELDILEAQGSARIAQANALIRIAKARGDEVAATRAAVNLARIEADVAREQAEQKQRIAVVAALAAQALEEQAKADGVVSAAEQKSIDESRALATQKQALAAAALSAAKALQAEANAQSGIKAQADLLERERKEREKSVDATHRQIQATQESTKAEEERSSRIKVASDFLVEMASRAERARDAIVEGGQEGSAEFQRLNKHIQTLRDNLEIVDKFGRSPRNFAANFSFGFGELLRNAEATLDVLQRSDEAMEKLGDSTLDVGELSRTLFQATQLTRNEAEALGDERLRSLRDAITDAQRRMADLGDQTDDARKRLSELDAELAEARGDDARAEQLRLELEFAEKLAEVEAQIAEARNANNRELLALLEEEREKLESLQKLREQAIEDNAKVEQQTRTPTPSAPQPSSSSGSGSSIVVNISSNIFDNRTLNDVARQLEKELKRIGALKN